MFYFFLFKSESPNRRGYIKIPPIHDLSSSVYNVEDNKWTRINIRRASPPPASLLNGRLARQAIPLSLPLFS